MYTLLTWMPSSSIPIKTCMALNAHRAISWQMPIRCVKLKAATAGMRELKLTANG